MTSLPKRKILSLEQRGGDSTVASHAKRLRFCVTVESHRFREFEESVKILPKNGSREVAAT